MRRVITGFLAFILLGVSGCHGPWIQSPTEPRAYTSIDERFVLAPVASDAAAVAQDGEIVAAIGRAMPTVLQESALLPRLILEQDAPAVLPEGRVFLVRFDVRNVVVTSDARPGGKIVALSLCCIGVLPLCAAFAARGVQNPIEETVLVEVQMRVFNVAAAEVRMFETESGAPRRIDISGIAPLFVGQYQARVTSRRGGRLDRGEDQALFNGEIANDLTRQIVDSASPDLIRVAAGAAAPTAAW